MKHWTFRRTGSSLILSAAVAGGLGAMIVATAFDHYGHNASSTIRAQTQPATSVSVNFLPAHIDDFFEDAAYESSQPFASVLGGAKPKADDGGMEEELDYIAAELLLPSIGRLTKPDERFNLPGCAEAVRSYQITENSGFALQQIGEKLRIGYRQQNPQDANKVNPDYRPFIRQIELLRCYDDGKAAKDVYSYQKTLELPKEHDLAAVIALLDGEIVLAKAF